MHRHVQLFADGPHRVVDVVRVRRVVAPLRRDEHAAVQAGVVRAPDLGDRAGDVAEDRRDREALAPLGRVRAQLGAPAVVRACAREQRARGRARRRSRARHRTARPCCRSPRRGRGRSPRRRRRRCRAPCRASGRPSRSAARPRGGSPRPRRGRTTLPGTRRRHPSSSEPRCFAHLREQRLTLDERLVEARPGTAGRRRTCSRASPGPAWQSDEMTR